MVCVVDRITFCYLMAGPVQFYNRQIHSCDKIGFNDQADLDITPGNLLKI